MSNTQIWLRNRVITSNVTVKNSLKHFDMIWYADFIIIYSSQVKIAICIISIRFVEQAIIGIYSLFIPLSLLWESRRNFHIGVTESELILDTNDVRHSSDNNRSSDVRMSGDKSVLFIMVIVSWPSVIREESVKEYLCLKDILIFFRNDLPWVLHTSNDVSRDLTYLILVLASTTVTAYYHLE